MAIFRNNDIKYEIKTLKVRLYLVLSQTKLLKQTTLCTYLQPGGGNVRPHIGNTKKSSTPKYIDIQHDTNVVSVVTEAHVEACRKFTRCRCTRPHSISWSRRTVNQSAVGRRGVKSKRGRHTTWVKNLFPLTLVLEGWIRVGGGIFELQAGGPAALAATLISNRCWREAASLSPSSLAPSRGRVPRPALTTPARSLLHPTRIGRREIR